MARSSSANGHLDKHLKDPFTTRDLLGVCRGRCVSKTCPGCPGGYLKCTADYYAKPPPLDPRAFAFDPLNPGASLTARAMVQTATRADADAAAPAGGDEQ